MTPLAALCLDATGTLIETAEPVGEVYRRHALAWGVDLPAWRLDDAFARILRRAPPLPCDAPDVAGRETAEREAWHERVRQTFQAADSTVRFEAFPRFAEALFEHYRRGTAWRLRPGAASTLATLRERGWRLGLVSNFDHRLPDVLQSLDLIGFFDVVAIPSLCGAAKPDPRPFEWAAERLETDLGALGYVGDDPPEVLAAIAALGIRTFDVRECPLGPELAARIGVPATLRPA